MSGQGSRNFRTPRESELGLLRIGNAAGLEIAALPVERLRRCHREGCTQRFVAHDLREKYCSELCKTKERNRAKLRYWEAHKPEILAERKKERLRARRRKKNVTRKTR